MKEAANARAHSSRQRSFPRSTKDRLPLRGQDRRRMIRVEREREGESRRRDELERKEVRSVLLGARKAQT